MRHFARFCSCKIQAPQRPTAPDRVWLLPLLAAVLAAALWMSAPARAAEQAPPAKPAAGLVLEVPWAPVPVAADGRIILAYELHILNKFTNGIRLDAVEVFGEGDPPEAGLPQAEKPLVSYGEKDLAQQTICFDAKWSFCESKRGAALKSGIRAVVLLWIALDPGQAAAPRLRHRVVFNEVDPAKKCPAQAMEGGMTACRQTPPPALAPPLKGDDWLAANGPGRDSIHWRAMIPIDKKPRIAQRFAVDWMRLGQDGRPFQGDPASNANWHCYGAKLLAVADGVISDVKDGIPENIPLAPQRAVPITLDTVGGNYVILALGKGVYAFYGHLQPGSLRVKTGQKVKTGDVLGLLGNSGNSDAPHLHFHLSDANSPLGAQGLPCVLAAFEWLGRIPPGADPTQMKEPFKLKPGAKAATRRLEMPLANDVVRFSEP